MVAYTIASTLYQLLANLSLAVVVQYQVVVVFRHRLFGIGRTSANGLLLAPHTLGSLSQVFLVEICSEVSINRYRAGFAPFERGEANPS